jgi:GDP-L-fucose synthase
VHLIKHYSGELAINIGSGQEVSIGAFARHVAKAVGFGGELQFDASRPDGVMRKLLDVSRLTALGWSASTGLDQGLALTYADFQARLQAGLIPA